MGDRRLVMHEGKLPPLAEAPTDISDMIQWLTELQALGICAIDCWVDDAYRHETDAEQAERIAREQAVRDRKRKREDERLLKAVEAARKRGLID